jgi:hypothetical protein
LVREFLHTVPSDALTVVGRCLSYGEGITYWPLAEIVRGVATDRDELVELLDGEADRDVIVERLSGIVGWGGDVALTVEIQWAVRRFFEALATSRPVLVVVLEDLHWAEPTLLDLLEYTAGIARGSILIVATARPELLEVRPDWASIGERFMLEPLAAKDAADVARAAGADEQAVARIVETADGNPLFVEQLAALGDDVGGSGLPASIGGVLRARLDAPSRRSRSPTQPTPPHSKETSTSTEPTSRLARATSRQPKNSPRRRSPCSAPNRASSARCGPKASSTDSAVKPRRSAPTGGHASDWVSPASWKAAQCRTCGTRFPSRICAQYPVDSPVA